MKTIEHLIISDIQERIFDCNYTVQEKPNAFVLCKLYDGRYAIEHRHDGLGTYFCEVGPKDDMVRRFEEINRAYSGIISVNINKLIQDG